MFILLKVYVPVATHGPSSILRIYIQVAIVKPTWYQPLWCGSLHDVVGFVLEHSNFGSDVWIYCYIYDLIFLHHGDDRSMSRSKLSSDDRADDDSKSVLRTHACIHTPACFPRPVDVRRAHARTRSIDRLATSLRLPTASFAPKSPAATFLCGQSFF
jgi:hypothetical protein